MRIKGSVLLARVAFLQTHHPDLMDRVISALSETSQAAVRKGFLPNGWYPVAIHNELVRIIDEVAGDGDRRLCRELGRHSCERNLTTIYRMFLRVGGIHFMLKRVAYGWKVHYDAGALTVTRKSSHGATLEMSKVPTPSPYHCLPVFAWCQRAVELAGYRGVTAEVRRCRRRGHDVCEFAYEWE